MDDFSNEYPLSHTGRHLATRWPENPSADHGGRSSDGSYAVSFHGPQQEMGRLNVLFPMHHRRGGLLGKIVQQGDDCLPAVPVMGDLLLEIIQPRARIILLGGLIHGKEDLSQQRSGKPSYVLMIPFLQDLQEVRLHGVQTPEEDGRLVRGQIAFLV